MTKTVEHAPKTHGHTPAPAKAERSVNVDDVKARVEDAKKALTVHECANYQKKFEDLRGRIEAGDTTAGEELYQLEHECQSYLARHWPQFQGFEADFAVLRQNLPKAGEVNMSQALARCESRVARLKEFCAVVG